MLIFCGEAKANEKRIPNALMRKNQDQANRNIGKITKSISLRNQPKNNDQKYTQNHFNFFVSQKKKLLFDVCTSALEESHQKETKKRSGYSGSENSKVISCKNLFHYNITKNKYQKCLFAFKGFFLVQPPIKTTKKKKYLNRSTRKKKIMMKNG